MRNNFEKLVEKILGLVCEIAFSVVYRWKIKGNLSIFSGLK